MEEFKCELCGIVLPITQKPEHTDHHFALNLAKAQENSLLLNSSSTNSKSRTTLTSSSNKKAAKKKKGNNSLENFLTPNKRAKN